MNKCFDLNNDFFYNCGFKNINTIPVLRFIAMNVKCLLRNFIVSRSFYCKEDTDIL